MNFLLREIKENDALSIYKHANNKKIADNLRNVFPHPYSLQDAKNFIQGILNEGEEKQYVRVIDVGGQSVGCVGVFLKDDIYCKNAEIGYWLSEAFWGNGIVSRAVKMICSETFEKYDIIRIYAEPFEHNKGSRKVLEKAGFTLEGIFKNNVYKNDNIYNSCVYALLK